MPALFLYPRHDLAFKAAAVPPAIGCIKKNLFGLPLSFPMEIWYAAAILFAFVGWSILSKYGAIVLVAAQIALIVGIVHFVFGRGIVYAALSPAIGGSGMFDMKAFDVIGYGLVRLLALEMKASKAMETLIQASLSSAPVRLLESSKFGVSLHWRVTLHHGLEVWIELQGLSLELAILDSEPDWMEVHPFLIEHAQESEKSRANTATYQVQRLLQREKLGIMGFLGVRLIDALLNMIALRIRKLELVLTTTESEIYGNWKILLDEVELGPAAGMGDCISRQINADGFRINFSSDGAATEEEEVLHCAFSSTFRCARWMKWFKAPESFKDESRKLVLSISSEFINLRLKSTHLYANIMNLLHCYSDHGAWRREEQNSIRKELLSQCSAETAKQYLVALETAVKDSKSKRSDPYSNAVKVPLPGAMAYRDVVYARAFALGWTLSSRNRAILRDSLEIIDGRALVDADEIAVHDTAGVCDPLSDLEAILKDAKDNSLAKASFHSLTLGVVVVNALMQLGTDDCPVANVTAANLGVEIFSSFMEEIQSVFPEQDSSPIFSCIFATDRLKLISHIESIQSQSKILDGIAANSIGRITDPMFRFSMVTTSTSGTSMEITLRQAVCVAMLAPVFEVLAFVSAKSNLERQKSSFGPGRVSRGYSSGSQRRSSVQLTDVNNALTHLHHESTIASRHILKGKPLNLRLELKQVCLCFPEDDEQTANQVSSEMLAINFSDLSARVLSSKAGEEIGLVASSSIRHVSIKSLPDVRTELVRNLSIAESFRVQNLSVLYRSTAFSSNVSGTTPTLRQEFLVGDTSTNEWMETASVQLQLSSKYLPGMRDSLQNLLDGLPKKKGAQRKNQGGKRMSADLRDEIDAISWLYEQIEPDEEGFVEHDDVEDYLRTLCSEELPLGEVERILAPVIEELEKYDEINAYRFVRTLHHQRSARHGTVPLMLGEYSEEVKFSEQAADEFVEQQARATKTSWFGQTARRVQKKIVLAVNNYEFARDMWQRWYPNTEAEWELSEIEPSDNEILPLLMNHFKVRYLSVR